MIKEAFEIFKKDINVIKNTPIALIILIAIMFIPAIYALPNIEAAWNPYSTSDIKVAVVNDDSGYTTNGSHYNVGNTLVDELKNNTNFSWQFVDKNNALNGVKNGTYYAALIIPSNFSENLLSIQTTAPQQAQIQYIVNDKLSPAASKLTSAGADTVQTEINDEIVKTVDGIIFGKLSDVGEIAKENKAKFLKLRSFVNELNGKIGAINSDISEANSDMNTIQEIWPKVNAALPEIQNYSNTIRKNYDSLYNQIESNPQAALSKVQNMETQLNTTITGLKYVDAILTTLYNATGDAQLKPVITQIETDIGYGNQALTVLQKVETDIKEGKNPKGELTQLKTLIDEMDDGVNTLVANKASINQKINSAEAKLSLVNSKWPTVKSAIPIAAAKLNSINVADIDKLIAFSNTNQADVKNYFESPVELEKEHMYPVDNYGSAVAPFYIPIALWIGCLISVAMLNLRVASRRKYPSKSVYLGKMGIFLTVSIFQALIVALGTLWLHVQISSVALFILTMIYIGSCFMIIVYSLTSFFGNVGKFIAVVILILQVAASGGIFPVEVLPTTFQAIHPYLPFTYAISAIREIVAGVLWSNYLQSIITLAIFPALLFILTLFTKEKFDEKTQETENKLKKSGIFQ